MNKFRVFSLQCCFLIPLAISLSSCNAKSVGTTPASITPTVIVDTSIPTSTPIPTSTISPTKMPTETANTSTPSSSAPGLIFYGGEILTMEENQPAAQAVAVLGEKIIAVGSDAEILDLQSPQTILVQLNGLTIMPGFVDAHSHLFNSADQWGLDKEGAQQLGLEFGITSLANMYSDPVFLSEMKALSDSGRLKIRTSLYLSYNTNCGEVLGDWYQDHSPTLASDEMLRIAGVKLFTDGGSCGAPAVSYEHPVFGYGDLWFTQDEFNAALLDIHASGRQAAIHALGDRAVEQSLNAIEYVLGGGDNTLRHRIEHNALVRDDLLDRYSEIGVVPLIFGSYPICAPDAASPPAEQDGWEWRYRELVDRNPSLHFAWHSDMHTQLFAQISPLQHLFSMVTPFEVGSDGETICETAPWVAEKTLSVAEVLPMMTIEGAYAIFSEDVVGSIRPGKFADLIILSGNPLDVGPEEIIDLRVLTTIVGGRVEYCAAGYEEHCPEY